MAIFFLYYWKTSNSVVKNIDGYMASDRSFWKGILRHEDHVICSWQAEGFGHDMGTIWSQSQKYKNRGKVLSAFVMLYVKQKQQFKSGAQERTTHYQLNQ